MKTDSDKWFNKAQTTVVYLLSKFYRQHVGAFKQEQLVNTAKKQNMALNKTSPVIKHNPH